MGATSGAGTA